MNGPRLEQVRYVDGVPDVTGLRFDAIADGDYRLDRFHLVESPEVSIRFHHLVTSDRDDPHDHPWDYVSTILAGAYREITEGGSEVYRAPVTLIRSAEHAHRLEVVTAPCWSLIVTGPARRRWGFHTEGGWIEWGRHIRGDAC